MWRLKSRNEQFSTLAMAGVLIATCFLVAIPAALAGDAPSGAAAKATFRAKCSMCHGPDGAGSEVGKSMNIPDLRSSTVQKLSDSELTGVITNGKNGMPAFKGSLDAGQIHGLVGYVRTLAAKK